MKRTIGLIFWFAMLFMVLASCMGDLGAGLDGTSWRLISLGSRPALPGGAPTLAFENGGVSGNSGCNSFGGEYKVRGGQIEFDQIFSTLMACAENERMEQETLYMQMLGQVDQYALTGGQLILTTRNGQTLLFVSVE